MDIQLVRKHTPGCEKKIHFNNAGAALVSNHTLQVQLDYLQEEARYGSYETAAKYEHQLARFYDNAAQLINADPDEIAFVESATVAWQRVFWAIDFQPGDEVICDTTSYASNYIAFINAREKAGINIVRIKQTPDGELDLHHLEAKITSRSKLISITHMPTNSGLVNPAEAVGQIAAQHDVLYQLDACQSVGQYPVDVQKINCDFLSTTGRKYLRGPRGTGFLFIKKSCIAKINPLSLDLHAAEWIAADKYQPRNDAKKFETWECNIAAKLGLSAAIAQANSLGIHTIWHRVVALADYLRQQLSRIDTIEVTDIGQVKSGIVTINSSQAAADQLKNQLIDHNINTVVAIKSGTRIDMEQRQLNAVLRISVHYYNTKAEIDTFVALLKQLVNTSCGSENN